MFCRKMIQLLLNKTTPHFQLLPMSKVAHSLGAAFTVTKKSYNTLMDFPEHINAMRMGLSIIL